MSGMGRQPSVKPVKQLAMGFGREQWDAIEEFQRTRRVSSITEAVRQLIWKGLEAEGLAPPPTPVTRTRRRSR